MHNIIYLAMDNIQIVKECAASIFSLHYIIKNEIEKYRIVIYTNLTEEFKKYNLQELFPIEYIQISDALKREWIHDTRYIYKIKIHVLLDFLQKRNQNLVFLDGDTFLLGDIGEMFNILSNHKHVAFMNYPEKNIKQLNEERKNQSSGRLRFQEKIYEDLRCSSSLVVEGKSYKIEEDFSFWNSGVLGVTPRMKDCLEEALVLNDYFLKHYKLLTSEQTALSVALSQNYQIIPADHIIYHYWFLKETRYLVEAALNLPLEFEKKYLLSPVIQSLQQNKRVEYKTLEKQVAYFINKKDHIFLKGLYSTISPSSYLGQSLRNYV
jgi:hypothetical protein